jgi:putative hemin transport protein
MNTQLKDLKSRWNELLSAQPSVRIRNAAETLGVSEVELLSSRCGEGVTRLKPEFSALMQEFSKLGWALGITRNDSIVHERKGDYLGYEWTPHAALFVGEDIDLRFFHANWKYALAVVEGEGKQTRRSIQLFDKFGLAMHKVYLTERSNLEAYETLVDEFRADDQGLIEDVETYTPPAHPATLRTETPDFTSFQQEWVNLKDTHHFFGLINKYKLHRIEALEWAPSTHYAEKIENDGLRKAIMLASERDLEIMVFVGNRGAIGIHTGLVKKIVDFNEWLNVLDPDFNLHIREKDIAQTWIVRKPTEDGVVTSLECFDSNGELIITLFGKRKPGIPEMQKWRKLILDLK